MYIIYIYIYIYIYYTFIDFRTHFGSSRSVSRVSDKKLALLPTCNVELSVSVNIYADYLGPGMCAWEVLARNRFNPFRTPNEAYCIFLKRTLKISFFFACCLNAKRAALKRAALKLFGSCWQGQPGIKEHLYRLGDCMSRALICLLSTRRSLGCCVLILASPRAINRTLPYAQGWIR